MQKILLPDTAFFFKFQNNNIKVSNTAIRCYEKWIFFNKIIKILLFSLFPFILIFSYIFISFWIKCDTTPTNTNTRIAFIVPTTKIFSYKLKFKAGFWCVYLNIIQKKLKWMKVKILIVYYNLNATALDKREHFIFPIVLLLLYYIY